MQKMTTNQTRAAPAMENQNKTILYCFFVALRIEVVQGTTDDFFEMVGVVHAHITASSHPELEIAIGTYRYSPKDIIPGHLEFVLDT